MSSPPPASDESQGLQDPSPCISRVKRTLDRRLAPPVEFSSLGHSASGPRRPPRRTDVRSNPYVSAHASPTARRSPLAESAPTSAATSPVDTVFSFRTDITEASVTEIESPAILDHPTSTSGQAFPEAAQAGTPPSSRCPPITSSEIPLAKYSLAPKRPVSKEEWHYRCVFVVHHAPSINMLLHASLNLPLGDFAHGLIACLFDYTSTAFASGTSAYLHLLFNATSHSARSDKSHFLSDPTPSLLYRFPAELLEVTLERLNLPSAPRSKQDVFHMLAMDTTAPPTTSDPPQLPVDYRFSAHALIQAYQHICNRFPFLSLLLSDVLLLKDVESPSFDPAIGCFLIGRALELGAPLDKTQINCDLTPKEWLQLAEHLVFSRKRIACRTNLSPAILLCLFAELSIHSHYRKALTLWILGRSAAQAFVDHAQHYCNCPNSGDPDVTSLELQIASAVIQHSTYNLFCASLCLNIPSAVLRELQDGLIPPSLDLTQSFAMYLRTGVRFKALPGIENHIKRALRAFCEHQKTLELCQHLLGLTQSHPARSHRHLYSDPCLAQLAITPGNHTDIQHANLILEIASHYDAYDARRVFANPFIMVLYATTALRLINSSYIKEKTLEQMLVIQTALEAFQMTTRGFRQCLRPTLPGREWAASSHTMQLLDRVWRHACQVLLALFQIPSPSIFQAATMLLNELRQFYPLPNSQLLPPPPQT